MNDPHEISNSTRKRHRVWKIVLCFGMALTVTAIVYIVATDCNWLKRATKTRAANRYIGMVAQDLLDVAGREELSIRDDAGGPCGSIKFVGELKPPATAEALRAEIAATKPPVQVSFNVWYSDGTSNVQCPISPISESK